MDWNDTLGFLFFNMQPSQPAHSKFFLFLFFVWLALIIKPKMAMKIKSLWPTYYILIYEVFA